MSSDSTRSKAAKPGLHPRNIHQGRYDFDALVTAEPALSPFVKTNPRGEATIDFADSQAVKALNGALLKACYGLAHWAIPDGYLCPPIPGRADYIHHLADLLAADNDGKIPRSKKVKVFDLGTGANCIYPIIGHRSYGWKFVASDIDPLSVEHARHIARANKALKGAVELRQQANPEHFFSGILKEEELIDCTLCNPPFHASAEAAAAGSERKVTNLGQQSPNAGESPLNFGGQSNELWCDGGEAEFIRKMIIDSESWQQNCLWFTSLVSHKENLPAILRQLKKSGAKRIKTVDMAQGQKRSRFIAWTFFSDQDRSGWAELRWR